MESTSIRHRTGRIIYVILAVLFAACIAAQIFIAGMAIFVDAENWMTHTRLVHLFGLNLPVLLLISAFIGAMPRRVYGQLLGAIASIFLMYFTANMTAILPWFGAMHPVAAVLLFILACAMVRTGWQLVVK